MLGRRLPAPVRRLARSPFLRNVAVLATGTAAAQVLTALAYPLLVRLFSPAEFGLFALFGALNMTMVVVASGRYELAIVLARTPEEAMNILALAMLVVMGAVALTAGAVAAAGEQILNLFGAGELGALAWFLPLAVFASSSNTVLTFWGTRDANFKAIAVSQIWRSFGVAVLQIMAGLARWGTPGLILGQIGGSMMATVALTRQFKGELRAILSSLSWSEMGRMAREHASFPLYNAPAALVNSTTVTLPPLLMTALFSPTMAGLYWFTYRLLELPMNLIGTATRRVFYGEAVARVRRRAPVMGFFLRITGSMAVLAVAPTVVLMLVGPQLYALVFGEAWREAGVYAQWIVVWWFMRFVSVPAFMLAPVFDLQRFVLVAEIAALIPRLLVFPIAAAYSAPLSGVAAYALIGIAQHLAMTPVVIRRIRQHDAEVATRSADLS